jgi:hypothetical protein
MEDLPFDGVISTDQVYNRRKVYWLIPTSLCDRVARTVAMEKKRAYAVDYLCEANLSLLAMRPAPPIPSKMPLKPCAGSAFMRA